MNKRIFLLTSFMILFLGGMALADYHYASHTGTSTPPYASWATAADSVYKAIRAASAGDTIYVGAGVWSEVDTLDFYMALIGKGIDSSIYHIDSFYQTGYVYLYSGTLLEGFSFLGDNNGMGAGAVGDAFDSLITIKNCKFTDLEIGIGGSYSGTIVNCIFEHNSWCGACLDIVRSFDMVIKNNTFIDDSIYHLGLYAGKHVVTNNLFLHFGDDGLHILLPRGDSVYFANNVIYKTENGPVLDVHIRVQGRFKCFNNIFIGPDSLNPGQYGNIGIMGGPLQNDTMFICNTIVMGFNQASRLYGSGGVVVANYNDYWHNDQDFYLTGVPIDTTGIIHADPMFADTAGFQLQMFSPLIDAGDPAILDEDGTRSDIGCYGGPGGCSYTYLDLAPKIPDSITIRRDSAVVQINWPFNTEADFNHYQVFRDTISGFEPSPFNRIAEPETSSFVDQDVIPNAAYYYRLTAVDNQRNVSDYSDQVAAIPTGIQYFFDDCLPRYTTIESAYPNPSNANITIVYSASNLGPQPPLITLKIYDIQGREVRTLVNEKKSAGTYRIVWDGAGDNRQKVASGVYIAKVSQWGCSAGDFPLKMTVIK